MPITMPRVGYEWVQLEGGLDVVTNVMSIPGGRMVGCSNFEIDQWGGYRRIAGYERFDGHASPSSATYTRIPVTFSDTISVGQTVTGALSSASGKVIALEAAAVIVTRVTGTFLQGENIQVSGITKAVTTDIGSVGGAVAIYDDANYLNLAADEYRGDIAYVPGAGQIRGVHYFNDTLYAFRNNVGETECKMYKSSSSGWVAVDLGYEVSFSNANTSVADGDTLTQGGVTATIKRVVVQTGTLQSGTNTGRLIISAPSGGNFAAGAATSTGGGALTLSGAQTAITLLPNGKFEFIAYDFGSPGVYLYGCDGVNRAFEFDGTVFVPLSTGMSPDAPKYIGAFKNHLFLTFGRSLQHSGIGNPYTWSVVLGAAEINAGDTITGIVVEPGSQSGGAMTVYCRNKTNVLYGSSTSDWNLVSFQSDSGALDYTVQRMGNSYCLDDRGINRIGASQNYGNFDHSMASRAISPILAERRFSATCSTINRFSNQYRVFFADGSGVYMSVDKDKILGFTQVDFPNIVRRICTVEDSSGEPQTFFGSDDGYIYHMEKGTSFDGANIIAFFSTPYYHFKSPRMRKRFRTAVIQTKASSWVQAQSTFYMGYGAGNIGQESTRNMQFSAAGSALWDIANWDELSWDGVSDVPKNTDLQGTSENLSCVISCDSDMIKPFTISGFTVHFTERRLAR